MKLKKENGAYAWIWLPGASVPRLCGYLRWSGRAADFSYVRSYTSTPDAIAVTPGWPLARAQAALYPPEDDSLPGFIADVGPGRWGEYVVEKLAARNLNPFERLLLTSGDRTGAIEFSDDHKLPPQAEAAVTDLTALARAVADLDADKAVDPTLALVLRHGPSLGGRRPKAMLQVDGEAWIAKFGSAHDRDPEQPRREAFGLALAQACGIEVPAFRLVEIEGRPVLLVKRFDRWPGGLRTHVLSARTLLGLSERQSLDVGSYPELAHQLRRIGASAGDAARWFDRMVFNVAIGNTDDHVLNHLFGWDGTMLTLMPAYDLEPQPSVASDRSHQMIIGRNGKAGSFENAASAHADFGLRADKALQRIEHVRDTVAGQWRQIAQDVGITDTSRVADSLLLS